MHVIDITGQRFGRLTVIERAGSTQAGLACWRCHCDCGNEIIVRGHDLRQGKTQSCHCWQRESRHSHTWKHGHSLRNNRSVEYRAWCNMMSRCYNPNVDSFKYYGGRGIVVCDRWHTFETFIADVGRCPEGCESPERVDGNGNYEPSNFKWIPFSEQAKNRHFKPR